VCWGVDWGASHWLVPVPPRIYASSIPGRRPSGSTGSALKWPDTQRLAARRRRSAVLRREPILPQRNSTTAARCFATRAQKREMSFRETAMIQPPAGANQFGPVQWWKVTAGFTSSGEKRLDHPARFNDGCLGSGNTRRRNTTRLDISELRSKTPLIRT